jgi:serine/threonine-protein kinase
MLQIGDQFDHFQIRSHIARGGMGDVYSAFDLIHSREAVLKIPDIMFIGDPAYYERFQRELEVMRTLNHPAIQKGLGSGRFKGMPYLVTELIKGESLRERLKGGARIPPGETIDLIRRIADALAYCHYHEIVHRDVKPENILVSPEGQPILLDFGLALSKNGHRVTYANVSGAAGTPEYMAPEQIEGRRGDRRSDVYSLGIMMFEMLTGEVPFCGDSNLAVVAQHLHARIPRLDRDRHGVSPQLATVVARCLQRKPDARYPGMHELIHDLDHLESVDISGLDRMTGPATATSYSRSPLVVPFAIAGMMMVILVILGFLLQALYTHGH